MLKAHEYSYIAGRTTSISQVVELLGRGGSMNGYQVQVIRSEDKTFLAEPDRRIRHADGDKIEYSWTRLK